MDLEEQLKQIHEMSSNENEKMSSTEDTSNEAVVNPVENKQVKETVEEAKVTETPKGETSETSEASEHTEETPKLSRKERRALWWEKNKDRVQSKNDPRDEKIRELEEKLNKLMAPKEGEKSKKDYANEREYFEDIADKRFEKILENMAAQQKRQYEEQEKQNSFAKSWHEKIMEQIPEADREDYDKACHSIDFNDYYGKEISDYVTNSDMGPALHWFLIQNPEEVEKIKRASGKKQDFMLFNLENRLQGTKPKEETKQEERETQTPRTTGKLAGNQERSEGNGDGSSDSVWILQKKLTGATKKW